MATIGRNSAVAQLGAVKLSGFPGWVMWLGVHLINVVSLRAKLFVLAEWAVDYLRFDRPIRLIVRALNPPRWERPPVSAGRARGAPRRPRGTSGS
jgi:hypothetical protein